MSTNFHNFSHQYTIRNLQEEGYIINPPHMVCVTALLYKTISTTSIHVHCHINIKISHIWNCSQLIHIGFSIVARPVKFSHVTKTGTNITKNLAGTNLDIVLSLRISSHLPVPTINGRGDIF